MTPDQLAEAKQWLARGYSPVAVAMSFGGPVGSPGYYACLEAIGVGLTPNCPYCGEPCFGTGDCNCHEE